MPGLWYNKTMLNRKVVKMTKKQIKMIRLQAWNAWSKAFYSEVPYSRLWLPVPRL
jgi:hypothetical protein